MDLADVEMLPVAEREGIRKIVTRDRRNFSVYLVSDRVALRSLLHLRL